jgi:hypothetical protein
MTKPFRERMIVIVSLVVVVAVAWYIMTHLR